MLRYALALALGISVVTLANYSVTAQDAKKDAKDTKTIEGKLVCTKCTLGETKACGHAVKVKEGDKEVVYYLADKGGKEKYHKDVCPGGSELEVKVTGKLVEKDKKKTIEDPKVEKK
jgi:hypothetical protein